MATRELVVPMTACIAVAQSKSGETSRTQARSPAAWVVQFGREGGRGDECESEGDR